MSPPGNRSRPLIERYSAGGGVLKYAVADLTPEQAQARPGPGAWSIAELVGHLLDADLVYAERMKRVIAEENPTLVDFNENAWIARLGSQETPIEEAVSLLIAGRRWMSPILSRLSDEDFARSGTHTVRGRTSLADLLATITNHIDHHLRFLYTKRSNLGFALPPRYTSEGLGY